MGDKELSVRIKVNLDAADVDAAINAMTAKLRAGLASAFGQNFDPFATASKSLDSLIQKSRTLGQATRSGTSGGTSIDRELDAMTRRIKMEDQLEQRASRRFDQDINRSRQEMASADRMYQQMVAGEEKVMQAKMKSLQVSEQLQQMNARTAARLNLSQQVGPQATGAYVQYNSTNVPLLSAAQQSQANFRGFQQQYGKGLGGVANFAGQQVLGGIGVSGGMATTIAAAGPLIGTAVEGVKDMAKYFGDAYERTKDLTNNIGRMQRILGGNAQEAGRLYSSLRLIGQEDNVFATITFNQIQAALARQQQIRAGTLTANNKDEQFAQGVSDIGLNTTGVKTFNDFAVKLSEKLDNLGPLQRSEAIQNIGGLFGQDLANLVGFDPKILKEVFAQQMEITQADLKANEERQLAYTKADTAVANFEAALTRAVVPLDTLFQTIKVEAFTGLTGLTKLLQGGQPKEQERGLAQQLLAFFQGAGGGVGIMAGVAQSQLGFKLKSDAELADAIKDLQSKRGGFGFDQMEIERQLGLALKEVAQRRLPGLDAAGETRDLNAYPGVPAQMTRTQLEDGLKDLEKVAKEYDSIAGKIEKLQTTLRDLNKAYYGGADAGFKQILTGAAAIDQQFKDYAKLTTELAKTPQYYNVTRNVMSDGTVTYGSSGASKAKKPASATALLNQQTTIDNLLIDLKNAPDTLGRELEDVAQKQAKVGKGQTTQLDVSLQQQQYDKAQVALRNKAAKYQILTGKPYTGPGADTIAGIGGPIDPSTGDALAGPSVVSSSTYRARNKKFDKLTKDQADFLKEFNGQGLDTLQTVFDDYSKFLIDAGKGNTQMFSNFRNQGVDAITGIAKAAGKVDFGFLEQSTEAALKLKLYMGEIDYKTFAESFQKARASFLDIGAAAENPKKLTAQSLAAAGIITPEQAAGAAYDPKKFQKSKEFKAQVDAGVAAAGAGFQDDQYTAAPVGKKGQKAQAAATRKSVEAGIIAQAEAQAAQAAEIRAAVAAANGETPDMTGIQQLTANKYLGTGKAGSTKGQDPGKQAFQLQYEFQAIITGKDGKETTINKELASLDEQLSIKEKEFNDKKLKVGITAEIAEVDISAVQTAIDTANANIDAQLATIQKNLQVNISVSVNGPGDINVPGPTVTVGAPYIKGKTPADGVGDTESMGSPPPPPKQDKPTPKYASGGRIKRGRMSMVGEEGPELVMPMTDGQVFTAADTRKLLSLYDQFEKSMAASPFPKSLASSPYAGLPDGAQAAINTLGYDFGGQKRKAMLAIEAFRATGSLRELEKLRALGRQSDPSDLQVRQMGAQMFEAARWEKITTSGRNKDDIVNNQAVQAAVTPAAAGTKSPLDLLLGVLGIKRPAILDTLIKKPIASSSRGGSARFMAAGGLFRGGSGFWAGENGPELIADTDARAMLARMAGGGMDLASGGMGRLSPISGGAYPSSGSGMTVVNVDARGADSPVTTVAAVKRTAEQLFMSNAMGDRRQARRAGRQDK